MAKMIQFPTHMARLLIRQRLAWYSPADLARILAAVYPDTKAKTIHLVDDMDGYEYERITITQRSLEGLLSLVPEN